MTEQTSNQRFGAAASRQNADVPDTFTAEPSTLRTLVLQLGLGFYVPVNQREFTWGEAEIDRRFDDIDHGITRTAESQPTSTFLGSVILVSGRDKVTPRQPDALPTTVLHVIDASSA